MIPEPLASFLEEGIAVHLGAAGTNLEPHGVRAIAVRVENDGRDLVVFVPAVAAGRVLPALRTNGRGAVLFGRPVDDRSVQVKGTFVDVRDGRDDERPMVERQWLGLMDNLGRIGIPRAVFANWSTWPVVAIRLTVTSLFEQTPGPGAGEALK